MQVGFLYSLIPVVILEKDEGVNENYIFLVRVNKNNKIKDKHYELTTSKMRLRTLGFHGLMWMFNKEYRIHSELEAFEETYIHNPGIGTCNRIVSHFYTQLDLGLSRKEISKLVLSYYM